MEKIFKYIRKFKNLVVESSLFIYISSMFYIFLARFRSFKIQFFNYIKVEELKEMFKDNFFFQSVLPALGWLFVVFSYVFVFGVFVLVCIIFVYFGKVEVSLPFSFWSIFSSIHSTSLSMILAWVFISLFFFAYFLFLSSRRGLSQAFWSLLIPGSFFGCCARILISFSWTRKQFKASFSFFKIFVFWHSYGASELVEYGRTFSPFTVQELRVFAYEFLKNNPGRIVDWHDYLASKCLLFQANNKAWYLQVYDQCLSFFSFVSEYVLLYPDIAISLVLIGVCASFIFLRLRRIIGTNSNPPRSNMDGSVCDRFNDLL